MAVTPPDTLANTLFGTLTAGTDFSVPAVDLTGTEFQFPVELGNELYTAVDKLTEADLTDRTVGGNGMFDALMASMNGHLKQEYEKSRITGAEYASAYIQLTQAAMGQAVQYLLAKDQSYWQAVLAQQQARASEINVVTARLEAEATKARVRTAQIETNTMAANYALTKLRLATESNQMEMLEAQKAQVLYQTSNILPAQLGQLTKETARMDYELTFTMPKELERTTKQVEEIAAKISGTTAQTDQTLYQTSAILPAQLAGIQKDTDVKNYQLTAMMPAQVAGFDLDNSGKSFTNEFLLPSQLTSLNEQSEGHRAKTLDTRLDGVTAVSGAIGKQKELHQQQIDSYKRDAESKVAKMLVDTWVVQKSLDEGLLPPDSFTDVNINEVMAKLRLNLTL